MSYKKVIIKDEYAGINWVFRYDEDREVHYEFEVRIEAHPNN